MKEKHKDLKKLKKEGNIALTKIKETTKSYTEIEQTKDILKILKTIQDNMGNMIEHTKLLTTIVNKLIVDVEELKNKVK